MTPNHLSEKTIPYTGQILYLQLILADLLRPNHAFRFQLPPETSVCLYQAPYLRLTEVQTGAELFEIGSDQILDPIRQSQFETHIRYPL